MSDHRGKQRNNLSIPIGTKRPQRILQSTQDNRIRERRCRLDCVLEVVHGEDVLAGLDWGALCSAQDGIHTDGMKLFLSLDSEEGVEDGRAGFAVAELVAGDGVGDVVD